jgi:hypothetical protein
VEWLEFIHGLLKPGVTLLEKEGAGIQNVWK